MSNNYEYRPIPRVHEVSPLGSARLLQTDVLAFLNRLADECGDLGHFRLGPFPVLFLNNPDLIQGVLVDQADAFDKGPALHRAVRPVVQAGLFNSEDPLHRRQRKIMAPAFTPRHVASYADTIVSYTDDVQRTWLDGSVIDLSNELNALTMSIAGKVLFDMDVFSEADDLGAAISTALRYIIYAMFQAFPLPLNWPTARNREAKSAIRLIQQRMEVMIKERQRNQAERNDFLSILLRTCDEHGRPMPDQQVQDEALTLFIAGHETTATALSWCFYLLLTHPHVYDRVRAEIDSALSGYDPKYTDLQRLPYTL